MLNMILVFIGVIAIGFALGLVFAFIITSLERNGHD